METDSVIYYSVVNTMCIICGAEFEKPRAGKLYCSSRCKQFSYYHKQEIVGLSEIKASSQTGPTILLLREFQDYKKLADNLYILRELKRKKRSSFSVWEPQFESQLQAIESTTPEGIKDFKIPNLSLEAWSFLRLVYSKYDQISLAILLSNLSSGFFAKIEEVVNGEYSKSPNPIRFLVESHLKKIAGGEILFN